MKTLRPHPLKPLQRRCYTLFMTIGLLLVSPNSVAGGDVVVIVHPDNTTEIDKNKITRIYFGRTRTFDDGTPALFIAQPESAMATPAFFQRVLDRNSSQVRAIWSKLMFTARAMPPQTVTSDTEVIKLVSENPNFIGYISEQSLTDKVRVIRPGDF